MTHSPQSTTPSRHTGVHWVNVAVLSTLLVAVLVFCGPPLRNVDWGWHVGSGERILSEGAIHWDDTFRNWGEERGIPPVFWLFQVIVAWLYRLGGVPALVALKAVLGCCLYIGLFVFMRRRGAHALWALCALVGIMAAVHFRLLLRPHLLSFIFNLLTVGILIEARNRRHLLWLLPPLFALWANLHPGVVLGIATLGAFGFGDVLSSYRSRSASNAGCAPLQARIFALSFLGCLVASCLTPTGVRLYTHMLELGDLYQAQGVLDHRPFSLADPIPQRLAAVALVLLAIALPSRRCSSDLAMWSVVAIYGIATLKHVRFSGHFLHMAALAAAPALGRSWRLEALAFPRAAQLALAALALWGASYGPQLLDQARGSLLSTRHHCPKAAQFLLAHPVPQPLYNTNNLGGYLISQLAGKVPIFWDGRQTLHAELGHADFSSLQSRFHFKTLVLSNAEGPLAAELPAGAKGWQLVFFSESARIYLDAISPETLALRHKYGYRHLRFLWFNTHEDGRHLRLVPNPRDLPGALAELQGAYAEQPQSYHVNMALAETNLRLGYSKDALEAALRAFGLAHTARARNLALQAEKAWETHQVAPEGEP